MKKTILAGIAALAALAATPAYADCESFRQQLNQRIKRYNDELRWAQLNQNLQTSQIKQVLLELDQERNAIDDMRDQYSRCAD
jgi:hypothetical protein